MALLERVTTLLRANINDLVDKAEDPEKLLKQLVLDMENQLLQVKTRVAVAVADGHLLERKRAEHAAAASEWQRKAELAVSHGEDDLARAALDRAIGKRELAAAFDQQIEDQGAEIESLRSQYERLRAKLDETTARCEVLLAQNRRARQAARAGEGPGTVAGTSRRLGRMQEAVFAAEAQAKAARTMEDEETTTAERLRKLERSDAVEALLQELKGRQKLLAG